jgi:formylglycine-generating enzyme required for sulfatase activity
MLALLQHAARVALAGMAWLPAGSYRPLHTTAGAERARVEAFWLDRDAVTRAEYLSFVRLHPEWRRSRATADLAEASYLADWSGDLDGGTSERLAEPVTGVSWFAANAYCVARGKRLPTTDEWEYAAAASETRRDATTDPAFRRRLVALSQLRGRTFRNVYGVSGLHGVIWEWTAERPGEHHMMHGDADHADDIHDASCAAAALGASDATNYAAFLRDAFRAGLTPTTANGHLGFRCAASS